MIVLYLVFHPLPLVPPGQAQAHLPHHRSLCGLSAHRGNLHAVHARGVVRCLGMDVAGTDLGLALTGVALKFLRRMSHPVISTVLYLLMGWLIIVAIDPLYTRLPAVRPGLAGCRRPGLYGGHHFLCLRIRACATAISSGTGSCWRAPPAIISPCTGTLPEPMQFALALPADFDNNGSQ